MNHNSSLEYKAINGLGATQIVEFKEILISKFNTHIGRIEKVANPLSGKL